MVVASASTLIRETAIQERVPDATHYIKAWERCISHRTRPIDPVMHKGASGETYVSIKVTSAVQDIDGQRTVGFSASVHRAGRRGLLFTPQKGSSPSRDSHTHPRSFARAPLRLLQLWPSSKWRPLSKPASHASWVRSCLCVRLERRQSSASAQAVIEGEILRGNRGDSSVVRRGCRPS